MPLVNSLGHFPSETEEGPGRLWSHFVTFPAPAALHFTQWNMWDECFNQ